MEETLWGENTLNKGCKTLEELTTLIDEFYSKLMTGNVSIDGNLIKTREYVTKILVKANSGVLGKPYIARFTAKQMGACVFMLTSKDQIAVIDTVHNNNNNTYTLVLHDTRCDGLSAGKVAYDLTLVEVCEVISMGYNKIGPNNYVMVNKVSFNFDQFGPTVPNVVGMPVFQEYVNSLIKNKRI